MDGNVSAAVYAGSRVAVSPGVEGSLIAVGALHLPRKNGLLALLQRAGHGVQLMP
jgi:uncharacterized protein YbaP (TraB family)